MEKIRVKCSYCNLDIVLFKDSAFVKKMKKEKQACPFCGHALMILHGSIGCDCGWYVKYGGLN